MKPERFKFKHAPMQHDHISNGSVIAPTSSKRETNSLSRGCLRTEPAPSDFGLSDDFDFRLFKKRDSEFNKITAGTGLGLIACISAWFASASWHESEGFGDFFSSFFLNTILLALAFSVVGGWKYLKAFVCLISGRLAEQRRVEKFHQAISEWEFYNLTIGQGFWQSLRGRDLERAAAKLFRDNGWQVEETALTGDGGVDLILRSGQREIKCQCKGYAKPVSVSVVREIAGVCSTSDASPMLIVVNGITKPAREEARKYSVKVWDSHELVQFAKGVSQLS